MAVFKELICASLIFFILDQNRASPILARNGTRLIQTSENKPAVWLNEAEIVSLIKNEVHFRDITDLRPPSADKIDVASVKGSLNDSRIFHMKIVHTWVIDC